MIDKDYPELNPMLYELQQATVEINSVLKPAL
jgi:hypothetical protein